MSFSQDYRPFQARAREIRQPTIQRWVDEELTRLSGFMREKLLAGRSSIVEDTIYLASMLRISGESLRAYKLHKNLLHRLELTSHEKTLLQLETGADLLSLKKADLGVSYFQQCLASDRNHPHALNLLARAYEYQGEFHKASMLLRRLHRRRVDVRSRLAFVLSEYAYTLIEQFSSNKARKIAEEAADLDPACPAATLARADAFLSASDFDDTVDTLLTFVSRWPDLTFMTVRRLEEVHFRFDRYAELETTLKRFLQGNSDNPHLLYFLGKILRKKKRQEEGVAYFKLALESAALDVHAMRELVHYNLPQTPPDLLRHARDFFERLRASRRFRCYTCHHSHPKMTWYCTACLSFGIPKIEYAFQSS